MASPDTSAKTRFGFTPDEWLQMRERARAVLREVAAERRTITYGDLAMLATDRRVSPRSAALGELLGDVCRIEDAERGIMLGSLVVRADTRVPGDGYFRHADELGRDATGRVAFWQAEVERVWSAYSLAD